MSFSFTELTLTTANGPRKALVMSPEEDFCVGSERLEELRRAGTRSSIDTSLLADIRARDERVYVVIFRGKGPGEARWTLDASLSDAEAMELASLLTASHLATWRELLVEGVWLMVHTEFGACAPIFREACRKLADELNPTTSGSAELCEVDRWILRNLTFYFGQSLASVAGQVLPRTLPIIENRSATIAELVTKVRGG